MNAPGSDREAWRPIETLGFGVEQHIVVATEYGWAWVVESDKDMNGEWIKRAFGKDAERTGEVKYWRLLDMPSPALSEQQGGEVMEAVNIHPQANPEGVRTEALVSIAVSLKRIADMMESEYPPRAAPEEAHQGGQKDGGL